MDYTNVLRYFKEALENEEYEFCQGFIDQALFAGANDAQIDEIIDLFLKGDAKASAQKNRIAKNRLKILSQKK